MKKSLNDTEFNFSYQNKDNMEMLDELGRTVARIAKTVPGGLLIFSPSYWLMETIYSRWEQNKILDEIQEHKMVHKEPKKASEY